jgi:nickel-dependent lactate racemase
LVLIEMRYGKKGLTLDLPSGMDITLIQKRRMQVLEGPRGAAMAAFNLPQGSGTLSEEAKGRRNACILVCDVTRPVPNALILPPLVKTLLNAGLPADGITILVATGLHRPNEGEELRELIGDEWVLSRVKVFNHFARNDADHVDLGRTPGGLPVKLDRRFVEADLRIVVGLVEPHFMAGYSGGRKVIIPGAAHRDTISALHSARRLTLDGVANCVLDGNPVHEEQLQAARMAGRCLAVNTVIDEDRRLSFVNFGALEESHRAAVAFAGPYFEAPVTRPFATVVTTAAGYPLDQNYYQTVKGMVGVIGMVEPDSDIFIVSECSMGLGTPEYAVAQARLIRMGVDDFIADAMGREYALIDEWESVMQTKAMRTARIHLFSECLTEEEKRLTGVRTVSMLSEAIAECVERKRDKRCAIVPEGPYVIPMCSLEKRRGASRTPHS